MAPAPPTRREVLILAVLLVVLIFLGNSDTSPSTPELKSPPPQSTNTSLHEAYTPHPIDTRLTWGSSPPPETTIVAHVPGLFPSFPKMSSLLILVAGWTVFDKLYIFKGVVYIVSDDRSAIPDVQFIYSKALFIKEGKEAEQSRLPTQEEIRVISTKEAKKLFGTGAHIIDGVTVRLSRYFSLLFVNTLINPLSSS